MRAVPFLAVAVLLALSLLVLPGSRRAEATTTTWTSTSDFDGGNKGLVDVPGSWSFDAQYPIRVVPYGATYGNYIYLAGGWDDTTHYGKKTYKFDPATHTYTALADMPENRAGQVSVVWADRMYIFGGEVDPYPYHIYSNVTEYYNITANTWTNLSYGPLQGEQQMAVLYNNLIWVAGVNGGGPAGVKAYNPVTNTTTSAYCSITTGMGAANGVIGHYWYFAGGYAGDTHVQRFDFNAHTCDTTYDTIPFTAGRHAVLNTNAVVNGSLFVLEGYKPTNPPRYTFYRDTWGYEPVSKTWTRYQDSDLARLTPGGAMWNGAFYLFGGTASTASIQVTEVFRPGLISHDGRNLVETSTDNPRAIAAGQFQLATGTADTFYRPDFVGDSPFWRYDQLEKNANWTRTAGGNASINDVDIRIAATGMAMETAYTVSGDFDVRFNMTNWGSGTGFPSGYMLQALNERVLYDSVTGFFWATGAAAKSTTVDGGLLYFFPNGVIQAQTVKNGTAANCGAADGSNGHQRYLRIAVSGITWSFYKSTNYGASWTSLASCTNTNAGPWIMGMGNTKGNNWLGGVSMRDYYLAAGTAGTGSYRTSGTWTTPTHVYAGETAKYVNVTYSGASATTYISQVRVLNATGTVLFSDSTHLTTGTSHSYLLTGGATLRQNFTVEVTLAGNGAASVAVESVSLYSQPPLTTTISATPANGYIPDTVAFTTTPTYGTAPFNYTWSFGDGKFAYTQNPSHVYTSSGDFAANITVTDAGGETATNTTTVRVRAPVVATGSATPTSGTYPLAVNFTATQTGGFAPFTYFWNFGDGANSTTRNVTHTYTTYGFYAVTLRVTDTYGNVGTATVHITVRPPDDVLWSGFLILLVLFLVFMGIGMVIHSPIWVLLSSFFGIFAALALALNLALFPYALVVVLLMFGFSLLTMIGSAFAMIGGGGGGL